MKITKVTKNPADKGDKEDERRWCDLKTKLKQQEAAPKRAEKTRMAGPKCATEKSFQH